MFEFKKAALISVTDKTGIVEFARAILQTGRVVVSTGGTADHLRKGGIDVVDVSEITGFPSIMDGRLKTLHPLIFGSILFDRNKEQHYLDAKSIGIKLSFDIVVVNLYNFKDNPSIKEIDIGGPSLLRAAAKNWHHVSVFPSPELYTVGIEELSSKTGNTTLVTREQLAGEVFKVVSTYDKEISEWFIENSEYN